jgi:lipopolysaccharide biosynthesis protein
MQSICIYASYFLTDFIPAYIVDHLLELQKYADKIVVVTNKKKLSTATSLWLQNQKIEIVFTSNKGYDFGKYYKAFKVFDLCNYNRIILMNDSTILVSPLNKLMDWVNQANLDIAGLMNSNERIHHLQSYFLVIQNKAIKATQAYFLKHKRFYKKRKVIRIYELGLSTYWQNLNFSMGSFINVNSIANQYPNNPSYFLIEKLMQVNIPLLKRHVIMNSFGNAERETLQKQNFILDEGYYKGLIEKYY